jgi:P-type Ca2+ transporter type 2C
MASPALEWSNWNFDEVLRQVQGDVQGFSGEEVKRRINKYGLNQLPSRPPPSILQIFLKQFRSSLIYLLLIAAVLSLFLGDLTDFGFILAVLLFNAAIGTFHETHAEKTSLALQKLISTKAVTLRDGSIRTVDAEFLVPGDIVLLESGATVPADIRLIRSLQLESNESLITGESLPVSKSAEALNSGRPIITDCKNTVFAGSTIIRGRARGVVVGTGRKSEIGQLAGALQHTTQGKPPIVERMEKFSTTISIAVAVFSIVIIVHGIFIQNQQPQQIIFFAIALAVSAIPEGLPVALSLALAIAARRMLKRGVVVRSLPSVEALGSCTLIASDKTGTLTCNEQTVQKILTCEGSEFGVTGTGYAPIGTITHNKSEVDPEHVNLSRIARVSVLCNEARLFETDQGWSWHGDPTDIALLSLANKLHWTREAAENIYTVVDEFPFESENQYSAVRAQGPTSQWISAKGAPEVVLDMCQLSRPPVWYREQALLLASAGFRTVALAEKELPSDSSNQERLSQLKDLRFLGFLGLRDPLRPAVKDAINICMRSGIRVFMITGDHPATAAAIGAELGLNHEPTRVVTGVQIESMSARDLEETIQIAKIYARITPHQKLRIVQTAQKMGHFVAVTGDGVNDTPALHAANIGIAMGASGTDSAREAANLVITDDNFSSIVAGVEEERIAYSNIRKIILLLVSTGCAEIVLVLLALATEKPLPLLPVHLLWLNLVTNGIQDVALAFEPGEESILDAPPRKSSEPIFDKTMIRRITLASATMGTIAFANYSWMLSRPELESKAQSATLLLMFFLKTSTSEAADQKHEAYWQ